MKGVQVNNVLDRDGGDRFKHSPFSYFGYGLFRSSLVPEEVSLEGSDLNGFISQEQKPRPWFHPRSSHRQG